MVLTFSLLSDLKPMNKDFKDLKIKKPKSNKPVWPKNNEKHK